MEPCEHVPLRIVSIRSHHSIAYGDISLCLFWSNISYSVSYHNDPNTAGGDCAAEGWEQVTGEVLTLQQMHFLHRVVMDTDGTITQQSSLNATVILTYATIYRVFISFLQPTVASHTTTSINNSDTTHIRGCSM